MLSASAHELGAIAVQHVALRGDSELNERVEHCSCANWLTLERVVIHLRAGSLWTNCATVTQPPALRPRPKLLSSTYTSRALYSVAKSIELQLDRFAFG